MTNGVGVLERGLLVQQLEELLHIHETLHRIEMGGPRPLGWVYDFYTEINTAAAPGPTLPGGQDPAHPVIGSRGQGRVRSVEGTGAVQYIVVGLLSSVAANSALATLRISVDDYVLQIPVNAFSATRVVGAASPGFYLTNRVADVDATFGIGVILNGGMLGLEYRKRFSIVVANDDPAANTLRVTYLLWAVRTFPAPAALLKEHTGSLVQA